MPILLAPDNPQERLLEFQTNMNKWLKKIPQDKGWYISGFVDGEGSFNVSFARKSDYRSGWQVTPSFNVSQRDISVLAMMKSMLGCGRLKQRQDGLWIFVVENPKSLNERVIPFFNRFKFLSSKSKKNFAIFCKIVEIIGKDIHLTKQGLEQIGNLREKLNEGRGRKRKYNLSDIMQKR